jgi:hypothetical protein
LAGVLEAISLADAVTVRFPRPGSRCRISGLSRTTLEELVAEGRIEAVRIKRRGNSRGITLMLKKSLVSFLEGLPRARKVEPDEAAAGGRPDDVAGGVA